MSVAAAAGIVQKLRFGPAIIQAVIFGGTIVGRSGSNIKDYQQEVPPSPIRSKSEPYGSDEENIVSLNGFQIETEFVTIRSLLQKWTKLF